MAFKREMGREARPEEANTLRCLFGLQRLTAFMFGVGAGWGAEENVLK